MAAVKGLNSILPKEFQEGETKPLKDFFDKTLVFHNCRFVEGKHGPYARILVSEDENSDQFYISTGASQAVEILRYLKENKLFPFSGKFVKVGDAILLTE